MSSVLDTCILFCAPFVHFTSRVLFSPPKVLFKLMLIVHQHSILSIVHFFGFPRHPVISVSLGHTLLERYGMTEIGMALSNPLHGSRLPVRHFLNPFSLRLFAKYNYGISLS